MVAQEGRELLLFTLLFLRAKDGGSAKRETDRGERVMLSWLDLCTVSKHGGRETKCPQGFMKPTVSTSVPSRLRVTLQRLLGKFKDLNPVTMHCTNRYLSCTNSRLHFTLDWSQFWNDSQVLSL